MDQSDLKVGMNINNHGLQAIPVYNTPTESTPILMIQAGQAIGQIVGFNNGVAGYEVHFISQPIYDAVSIKEKAYHWVTNWIPDWFQQIITGKVISKDVVSGAVNYSDLLTIPDLQQQVIQQQKALNDAAANNNTFLNSTLQGIKNISEKTGNVIPWKTILSIALVSYVVTHWSTFFKPSKIR